MEINSDILNQISDFDSFKMFKSNIENMGKNFGISTFSDCEEVTSPASKQTIYLLMKGAVTILGDDRTYKNAVREVKKFRRKREKAREAGEEPKKTNEPPPLTDFQFNEFSKSDYKIIDVIGSSFGNDKIVTNKSFRPSYVMSIRSETVIVSIPIKVIEDEIKRLANTGENKEKIDFLRHFDWYDNFTQGLKTKFNNCVQKRTFYPGKGAKIITEGKND